MKLEIRPAAAKPNPLRNLPIVEDCEAEIILVVDNREKRNANDVNYFFDRFKASGIKIELRSLPLGDFLWIVRVRNSFEGQDTWIDEDEVCETNNFDPDQMDENAGGQAKKTKKKKVGKKPLKKKKMAEHTDYVLDFIVERKTADDLAASIMDGRYEE